MKLKKIEVGDNKMLNLLWIDNSVSKIKLSNLRYYCPCAICRTEKLKQSKSYIPIYTKEQLQIKGIDAVGTYAISISWQDGHNTGIYDLNYLRSLS